MNNSNASFGDHDDSMRVPYALNAVFSAANSIIAFISVIGNFLVIVCFLKKQNLWTSTNYYITNMAVSDLLLVASSWTLYASGRLYGLGDSLQSSFQCKLGWYLAYVSYSVSVESLVLITVDRFIATAYPMRVSMITGKVRAICILFTWIIPMGIYAPFLYYMRSAGKADGPNLCITDARNLLTSYSILSIVLLYFIPLIVIIILNTRIMKSLRRTNPVLGRNVPRNTRRRQQNQRIMNILITIIVFFFTCWTLAYLAFFLLKYLQKVLKKEIQEILFMLSIHFLPIVSTAFNPVFLFVFSTNYRQALKGFLRPAVVKCCSCFMQEQATHEHNIELPELQ